MSFLAGGISSDIDFFNGVAITSQLSVAKNQKMLKWQLPVNCH